MKRVLYINIFLLFFRLLPGCGISKILNENFCSKDRLSIDNESASPVSSSSESSSPASPNSESSE